MWLLISAYYYHDGSNSLRANICKQICGIWWHLPLNYWINRCRLSEPLSLLLDLSLKVWVIIQVWIQTVVTQIHKSRFKHEIANTRQISLTPIVSKTLECFICDAILLHLSRHTFLNNAHLYTSLLVANRQKTDAICPDLSKEFY